MRTVAALLTVPLIGAVAGCTSAEQATATITVSAAASLTDAFTDLGQQFTAENPSTEVRFNFAGSSSLAEQIIAGAPVDVFAAASPAAMQRVVAAGAAVAPTVFAANSLAIAVPAGNPGDVTGLADLADSTLTFVVCAVAVPCGAAAQELFIKNGLDVAPASFEPDVRAVLTKVVADEVDAGVVYRTDLLAAEDRIDGIDIPGDANVVNEYPIAVTADAPEAQEFVDYVLGPSGQATLAQWGFTTR